mgnify:CR=1 FL=1
MPQERASKKKEIDKGQKDGTEKSKHADEERTR